MNLRQLSLTLLIPMMFAGLTAGAKTINTQKDVDTLGGNDALMDMATSMDTRNRSRIVQDRIVDRYNRVEVGGSIGAVAGGDAYMKTQNFGAQVDYHINPRFSLGVRYYDYSNSLTPEGQQVFDNARAAYAAGNKSYSTPDIDAPHYSTMAVINWYPLYGKINMFDAGIAQFDFYLLGGGGQIMLNSGAAPIYTGGAGLAFWITKHMTARTEVRYETYNDSVITGARHLDLVTGNVGIGFLL